MNSDQLALLVALAEREVGPATGETGNVVKELADRVKSAPLPNHGAPSATGTPHDQRVTFTLTAPGLRATIEEDTTSGTAGLGQPRED